MGGNLKPDLTLKISLVIGMTVLVAESCEGGECEWVVEGR
jgi:hypothetical protein